MAKYSVLVDEDGTVTIQKDNGEGYRASVEVLYLIIDQAALLLDNSIASEGSCLGIQDLTFIHD